LTGLAKAESLWLAPTPSKRWAELFFLCYSPVWIIWALGIIVPFQLYEVRQLSIVSNFSAAWQLRLA
jgi:hypothetical protein